MVKKSIITFIAAGIVSGCSFLDVTPDKSGNSSIYHIDQLSGLMGNPDLYGSNQSNAWAENIFFSDDVEISPYFYSKVNLSSPYQAATWDREWLENGGSVDGCTWRSSFAPMFDFNTVLENIDKVEQTTPELKEQVRGEALFGRAYYHFFPLVNFCRTELESPGIGYKDNTNPPPKGIPARKTVEYTIGRIREDIAKAKEALTKAGRTEFEIQRNFRITLPTVYAFEARMELYLGNYDAAFEAADKALAGYDVLEDFQHDPNYAKKVLRSVDIIGQDGQPTGETIDYNTMPQMDNDGKNAFYTYKEMYLPNFTKPYLANKNIPLSESLYRLFDREHDARWIHFYNNNFNVCQEGAFSSNGFDYEEQQNLKEWERHTYLRFVDSKSNTKLFILGPTTAEMFLIRAECYARKGEAAKAKADLVALRKARFTTAEAAEDIEGTLENVLDERRRELSGVLRFYDLKRLNLVDHANIVLTKKRHQDIKDFNSPIIDVTLEPTQQAYTQPLPMKEIQLMGWEQNK